MSHLSLAGRLCISYLLSVVVSRGLGDYFWAGKPSGYITSQPPRPTQPGHPSVSRHNEYWR